MTGRESVADLVLRERVGVDAIAPSTEGRKVCPHGDPYCPCQEGDSCHYRADEHFPLGHPGRVALRCPRTHLVDCTECTT